MVNLLKKIFHQEKGILNIKKIDYQDFCFLKQVYQGKKLKITTSGESMWPTIKEGEVITIKIFDPKKIKSQIERNNIIAFYSKPEGKIIAHRVTKRIEKGKAFYYQTKGDNVEEKDLIMVSLKYILGKVLN